MISLAQAARLMPYYINPASLRRACLRGTLKASKLGRDWVTTESDIKAYADRQAKRQAKS